MIEVNHLTKTFKVLKRREGLKGAFADLFSKDYEYVTAVKDVSVSIGRGEIIGYVGPNGAGKSTTIKMMTGILKPTSGEIVIDNREPYKNRREHMGKIGVVFGQRSQLWWSLPVRESFKVLKEIYRIEDAVYQENLRLFEKLVDIESLYAKPVRQMSLGQRMLCEVVASFLHNPSVVFLDEPTIGLDVAVKDSIRNLIRQLNKEKGTTIILTSHDTKDIESLCKRVAIIDKGCMIFDDSIDNLKQMFGKYRTIKIKVENQKEMFGRAEQIMGSLFSMQQVKVSQEGEDGLSFVVNEQETDMKTVLEAVLNNFSFLDLEMQDVGVEEVIKRIYEGGVEKGEAV